METFASIIQFMSVDFDQLLVVQICMHQVGFFQNKIVFTKYKVVKLHIKWTISTLFVNTFTDAKALFKVKRSFFPTRLKFDSHF